MPQNRRTFLASLGSALAGLTAGARPLAAIASCAVPKTLERIGVQMYTLRRIPATDIEDTLTRLAALGYKEVEWWGQYDKTPAELRAILNRLGLTAPSVHVGINAIQSGAQRVFDDARALGHEWLTAPSLPGGPKNTADDWKRVADQFNAAGTAARAAGLRFAFHNHNTEFAKVGDTTAFDILLRETDPALVSFQADIYHMVRGGGDPIDFFDRYPTRFTSLHVKDSSGPPDHRMMDVGAGAIDFKKVIARADQIGVKHYFVEHDSPADPMASVTASYRYLSRLEF